MGWLGWHCSQKYLSGVVSSVTPATTCEQLAHTAQSVPTQRPCCHTPQLSQQIMKPFVSSLSSHTQRVTEPEKSPPSLSSFSTASSVSLITLARRNQAKQAAEDRSARHASC